MLESRDIFSELISLYMALNVGFVAETLWLCNVVGYFRVCKSSLSEDLDVEPCPTTFLYDLFAFAC